MRNRYRPLDRFGMVLTHHRTIIISDLNGSREKEDNGHSVMAGRDNVLDAVGAIDPRVTQMILRS